MIDLAVLLVSVILLYLGAEWFVTGAGALALRLRIPQVVIGLTVVAYGTSAPELVVGIKAAIGGHGEVALGNVIGSNIVNIGLILALAVLIKPARADHSLRRRELPVLLLSSATIPVLLANNTLARWEGALLLGAAILYTSIMVISVRSSSDVLQATSEALVTTAASDVAAGGSSSHHNILRATITGIVGLGILLIGGNLFVDRAVGLAKTLGMSDRLIGLTIVAVGTSLPELVTSIVAAARGNSDVAIGNVIGSNIFNVLLCLGAAGSISPISVPIRSVGFDIVALFAMTMLAAFMIRAPRTITRLEGGLALACYLAFTVTTIIRG